MQTIAGGHTGRQYERLVIHNAMVVSGRGTPAMGPVDLVIVGGYITDIVKADPVSLARQPGGSERPTGDGAIDATGMYVLPGLIDMHAHVPTAAPHCGPCSADYAYRLWLGHGVTTLRTCGFGNEATLYEHRRLLSQDTTMPVPRLTILHGWPRDERFTDDDVMRRVADYGELGADGIKLIGCEPEVLGPVCEGAEEADLPAGVAVHLSLHSEADAVMASEAGVRTIEHTYGIPEAVLPRVQSFPPHYNEMDELERFRQSGFPWLEADNYPERVDAVLDLLIANETAWNPTLAVYEANRDLMRAQTAVYNQRYATPGILKLWTPTPGVHASFHFDWKTSDEVAWKLKYQIWLRYLRQFFERGGVVTAGSDAGYLYTLYGCAMIRELELLQEAGLHPLDVIKVATTNAAATMGRFDLAGGVRKGYPADLAIVDGNPLDNFKVMYGTGVEKYTADRETRVPAGGVRWTVRDGVVFDARALLQDVERYVAELRQ